MVSEVVLQAAWLVLVALCFVLGRWATARQTAGGGSVLSLMGIGVILGGVDGVPVVMTMAAGFLAGRALRERQLTAARLGARVAELEEEREAYARLSVRYERARIASELHDIVAHAISVMVVQAAAGQRLAGDPELTAETFEAIGEAARQAEADLERLVALLADREPIAQAPDLRLVEDLVSRAAQTGLDVSLELAGDREGLPEPTVQTAYRVVQESLTNALRYAAGAAVRVAVRGERDDLVVEVRNAAAARPATFEGATGHGLRGLRERLAELGGALDAGPTDDGGWAVRARLPRRTAPSAS